jgi:hypothetical protein
VAGELCGSTTLQKAPPHKNQKAHEVTRDVTAWAGRVFPPGALVRTDFLSNLLLGLGPPRSYQHERTVACTFTQTVGRDCIRRDRAPNRAAWRFPDWTAVGFTFPSPFLGSQPFRVAVTRTLRMGWARSVDDRGSFTPRFDESLAATLTRIAWGVFCASIRVASSLAADFRRARSCVCFARSSR